MYLELQRTGVYEILDHKFLVRGHTFLKNDRDFAQIEERKNSAKVVLPDDWVQVVRHQSEKAIPRKLLFNSVCNI